MIEQLLDKLKCPRLWQRSNLPFWDDEHISQCMLAAHLDPDCDAASRRPEFIDRSVEWLSQLFPAGGSVIDLGCGPGLYASRLAERGFSVTGLDISRRSLEYAREHDKSSRYILQSYLDMEFSGEFDAAILIYCDYAALTAPERAQLLKKIFAALKPGGKLVLDVFTPARFAKLSGGKGWSVCENGGFWSAKPHLCLDASYYYENRSVRADVTVVVSDDGEACYIVWDTAFTRGTLAEELRAAGFNGVDFYANVCGDSYSPGSETLCATAKRSL